MTAPDRVQSAFCSIDRFKYYQIETQNQEALLLARTLSRYNESMDLLRRVKTEKRLIVSRRSDCLRREISELKSRLELLRQHQESSKVLKDVLFENTIIKSTKLVKNSGYTLRQYRELLRQAIMKQFRNQVYPLLDMLDEEENRIDPSISALKRYRDHSIVHLDPRYAFIDTIQDTSQGILNDLEVVFAHIYNHLLIL
ncbi:MAG TPA: hypothetical protein DCE14_00900 [Kosmotogaceae bacterium]|nr:MAG: Uncharacterized protein XE05_0651 [Thermotogales bacterium 46_20]HAA84898.1 hypothetical protein [Kosmotogaceae bacterium]